MSKSQSHPPSSAVSLPFLGAVALVSLIVHGANHVRLGTPHDVLWACNAATLLLSIGCFIANARAVTIAFMWLCFGTPMWLLDLATGGVFMVTSVMTHIGALALAFVAVQRLGMPRNSWPWATVGLIGVMLATRYTTPPALNLNLAHAVWSGWEETFPRYDVYFAVVVGGFALTFFVVERVFARATSPR